MRLGLIALALLSSTAFACPQLAGKYAACRSTTGASDGTRDMVVTQAVVSGGYAQYSVTATDEETQERSTESIIADGQTRNETQTDPQSGMTFDVSTKASCVGNTLELQVETRYQGQPLAQVKSVISKSGAQLTTQTTGQIMGQNVNETVICQ